LTAVVSEWYLLVADLRVMRAFALDKKIIIKQKGREKRN